MENNFKFILTMNHIKDFGQSVYLYIYMILIYNYKEFDAQEQ